MKFNNEGGFFNLVNKQLALLVAFGAIALYFIDIQLSSALYKNNIISTIYINKDGPILTGISFFATIFLRCLTMLLIFVVMNISYTIDRGDITILFMYMMLIGGLANNISGIAHGGSIDYILLTSVDDKKLMCNIADIMITVGSVGYLFQLIKILFKRG